MIHEKGVLTIAHTHLKYARQAVTLARSIRYHTPGIILAVATDLDARHFKGLYDVVIPWEFTKFPGILCKLELDRFTPFKTTLFVETDCLAVRSLQPVFEYFEGAEFAVFGRNEPTLHYFQSLELIQAVVPSPTYPLFNGGLYYFKTGAVAERVFDTARQFLPRYDEFRLNRVYHSLRNKRGTPCDEPLIGLAMAKSGVKAIDDPRLDIMFAPERPRYQVDIDVLKGACSFVRSGKLRHPILPHFVGARDSMVPYLRESLRLEAISGGRPLPPWKERILCVQAYLTAACLKLKRQSRDRGDRLRELLIRLKGGPVEPALWNTKVG